MKHAAFQFLLASNILSILHAVAFRPTASCKESLCKLPDCRCSDDFDPPGKLTPAETPQVIMLTFDDGLNDANFMQYQEVFGELKNPNGCPAVGTFFLSHYYTNYLRAEQLYSQGHELADHSVTHRTPETWWIQATYEEWKDEMVGQKEILHKFAGVNLTEVIGFRAPFLAITENQYKALYQTNFTYDLSWPTGRYFNPPMYPYTLDYASTQDCPFWPPERCPKTSYPGLWVVPNIDIRNEDGSVCGAMLDGCVPHGGPSTWYDLLHHNFNYHYMNNRAPFGLHAHSAWLGNPEHKQALIKFLADMQKLEDVWILTASQVIEWMRDPKDVEEAKKFAPWGCPARPPPRCTTPHMCHYTKPLDIYMPTCTPCPPNFPSPTNPDGN